MSYNNNKYINVKITNFNGEYKIILKFKTKIGQNNSNYVLV
jgi:hypothetical protein